MDDDHKPGVKEEDVVVLEGRGVQEHGLGGALEAVGEERGLDHDDGRRHGLAQQGDAVEDRLVRRVVEHLHELRPPAERAGVAPDADCLAQKCPVPAPRWLPALGSPEVEDHLREEAELLRQGEGALDAGGVGAVLGTQVHRGPVQPREHVDGALPRLQLPHREAAGKSGVGGLVKRWPDSDLMENR